MFLQFVKEDIQEAHVKAVNQYIEIKQSGQILFEGKKHLALFMKIINHNNNKDNKCFETEKGTISYIYCHNISHIPNIIFGFTEKEVVLSQDLLFTYNKELSLYIMNISFINDNNEINTSISNQELIFDNDVSITSFGELLALFRALLFIFVVGVVVLIGVAILTVVAVIIFCCKDNTTPKNVNFNSINVQASLKSIRFPYEPQDISQPQVIHQTMLNLNSNIDYALFPKVPIYNI